MTPEEHDHIQHLEANLRRYRGRIVQLKDALKTAKRVIQEWQNETHISDADADLAWGAYQASPEMREINQALDRDFELDMKNAVLTTANPAASVRRRRRS